MLADDSGCWQRLDYLVSIVRVGTFDAANHGLGAVFLFIGLLDNHGNLVSRKLTTVHVDEDTVDVFVLLHHH